MLFHLTNDKDGNDYVEIEAADYEEACEQALEHLGYSLFVQDEPEDDDEEYDEEGDIA